MLLALILAWLPFCSSLGGRCVKGCNGHGKCDNTDVCKCIADYNGGAPDCSWRTCPKGRAWADKAYAVDKAHSLSECSRAGLCNRKSGKCECFKGYEGLACDRMMCAGNPTCNGRGLCQTIGTIYEGYNNINFYSSSVQYTNWDYNMTSTCVCDPGYTGGQCEYRMCPKGNDPTSPYNGLFAINLRTFGYNLGGYFCFSFQGQGFKFPAGVASWSMDACKTAFQSLPNVDAAVCSHDSTALSGGGTAYSVSLTFPTNPYENNLWTHAGSPSAADFGCDATNTTGHGSVSCQISVTSVATALKYDYCSSRGLCDLTTGQCTCYPGYTGSACDKYMPADSAGHPADVLTVTAVNSSFRANVLHVANTIRGSPAWFNVLIENATTTPLMTMHSVTGDVYMSYGGLTVSGLDGQGGVTVALGGLTVEGGVTVTAGGINLAKPQNFTLQDGGVSVAGGVTILTGGMTILPGGGGLTIEGGMTVEDYGVDILNGGLVIDSGGLSVNVGPVTVTGSISIAGGGVNLGAKAPLIALYGGMRVFADGIKAVKGVTVNGDVTNGASNLPTDWFFFVQSGGMMISSPVGTLTNPPSFCPTPAPSPSPTSCPRPLAVLSQGGVDVSDGLILGSSPNSNNYGLSVESGGLSIISDGLRVSGAAGLNIQNVGLKVLGGMTLTDKGILVNAGGLTVSSGGLTIGAATVTSFTVGPNSVTSSGFVVGIGMKVGAGLTITDGGLTVHQTSPFLLDGATSVTSVALNNALSILSKGSQSSALLIQSAGLNIAAAGLVVTGGLTVTRDGLSLSGGVTGVDASNFVTDTVQVSTNGWVGVSVTGGGVQVTGGVTVADSGLTYTASNADILSATGGVTVEGGLTVSSSGMRVSNGGLNVWSNAPVAVTGQVMVRDGLRCRGGGVDGGSQFYQVTIASQGLYLQTGSNLRVESHGIVSEAGGLRVSASGVQATGGLSLFDSGLTISCGSSACTTPSTKGLEVGSLGLRSRLGLTVLNGGVRVEAPPSSDSIPNNSFRTAYKSVYIGSGGLLVQSGGLTIEAGGLKVGWAISRRLAEGAAQSTESTENSKPVVAEAEVDEEEAERRWDQRRLHETPPLTEEQPSSGGGLDVPDDGMPPVLSASAPAARRVVGEFRLARNNNPRPSALPTIAPTALNTTSPTPSPTFTSNVAMVQGGLWVDGLVNADFVYPGLDQYAAAGVSAVSATGVSAHSLSVGAGGLKVGKCTFSAGTGGLSSTTLVISSTSFGQVGNGASPISATVGASSVTLSSCSVAAAFTASATSRTLTVTAVASGTVLSGMVLVYEGKARTLSSCTTGAVFAGAFTGSSLEVTVALIGTASGGMSFTISSVTYTITHCTGTTPSFTCVTTYSGANIPTTIITASASSGTCSLPSNTTIPASSSLWATGAGTCTMATAQTFASVSNAGVVAPPSALSLGGLSTSGGMSVLDSGVNIIGPQGLNVYAGGFNVSKSLTTISDHANAQNPGLLVVQSSGLSTSGTLRVLLGGMTVEAGGLSVATSAPSPAAALSVQSSGMRVNGGITVNSGGVSVTSQGLQVGWEGMSSKSRITTDTLSVVNAGISSSGVLKTVSITVTNTGALVGSGGATVTAGGLLISAGNAVVDAVVNAVPGAAAGLTVSGASAVAGGFTAPSGLISAGKLNVTTNLFVAGSNTTGGGLFLQSAYQTSDRRLKHTVTQMDGAQCLERLAALQPVYFRWDHPQVRRALRAGALPFADPDPLSLLEAGPGGTNASRRSVGFLAQEAALALPEAVHPLLPRSTRRQGGGGEVGTGAGAEAEGEGEGGYLGVQYSAFTAVLIEAMRAMAARLTPPPPPRSSSSSSSSASAGTEADETEEVAALRKAVQELSEAVAEAEAGAGAVARAVAGSKPYESSSRGAELPLGAGMF